VVHQVGLQLVLVVHDNGDIFMVRTQLAAILAVCLFILVKIFLIREKKIFGLD
jgi:undecaprenyl pyrophosphate phosphatase UppP